MIYSNNWNLTLPINQKDSLSILGDNLNKNTHDVDKKVHEVLMQSNLNKMIQELNEYMNSNGKTLLFEISSNLETIDAFKINSKNNIGSHDLDDVYSPNGKIPFPKQKNPYIQFQEKLF